MAVGLTGQATCVRNTVFFTYTLDVSGGTAPDVVLRTAQDANLPATDAVAATVRLDRRALPAGRVVRVGADLVVQLGDLPTGRHAVSFSIDVPASLHTSASNSASITVAAGAPQDSGAVVVAVNQADLRLRPVGEPAGAAPPLGAGRLTEVLVEADNAGSIDTAAEFDVRLPRGVEPGPVPVSLQTDSTSEPVACTRAGDTLRCRLDALRPTDKPITLAVDLLGTPGSASGTGVVRLSVQPVPDASVEAEPADNVLDAPIELLGTAQLRATMTPSSVTLRPGQRQTFTVRLTNVGPQPTNSLFAAVEIDQNGLPTTFVSFTGPGTSAAANSTVPTTGAPARGMTRANAARANAARAGDPRARPALRVRSLGLPLYDVRYWTPPELPAGASVVARVVVRAGSDGLAQLRLTGSSLAGDPQCPSAYENCPLAGSTVRVRTPVTPPAGSGSGAQLPNTGAPAARLGVLGGLLLVVGAGVSALGRRRRT